MTISIVVALMLIIPVSGYTSDVLVSGRPYLGKLQLQGEELVWSETSNTPLNKISVSGGPVTTMAKKLVGPTRLLVQGDSMFWVDVRAGNGPSCYGANLKRVLNKTRLDGSVTETSDEYWECAGGDDIVFDDPYLFFVTSGSYDSSLFKVPVAGGDPLLVTTFDTPIRGLTRDATHLYWYKGISTLGGSILRMPIGGGDITTIVTGDDMLNDQFVVHDGFLFFTCLRGGPVYWLYKVPVSGGTPTVLADGLTSAPKKYASAGPRLYWIDQAASLKTIPVDGGDITTLLQSDGTLNDLLVNTNDIFVTEGSAATPPAQGSVKRIPMSGGAPEVLVDNIEWPGPLALDATNVYWVEGSGGTETFKVGFCLRIGKAPLGGGSASTFIAGIGSDSASFAVDTGHIYLADGWNIKKVSMDGSYVEKLARDDFDIQDITTDGVNVYWIEEPFSTVKKVPVNGGPVTVIGGGYGPPGPVRVIDGYVYWMDHYDTIYRNSVDGSQFTTIASSLPFLSDMTVDGTNVYFSENDTGRIQKVPVNGGDITTLAYGSVYWMPYILAYDSDFVYWINAVEIGKVSKNGGNPATLHYGLLSDFDYPNSIVVDGANGAVYWTEVGGGTINKGSTEPVPPVNPTLCKVKVAKAKKNHGDGVVMSHDGYINCGPSCSVTYQSERVITFTATANEGSTFIGWKPASPNCSGTDPCTINLRGNTTTKIKAIFVGDYTLKVISQGKKGGNGTVTSIPSSIHCITGSTAGCDAPYGYGEEVTLTVSADIGSTFLGWKPSKRCPGTGDCSVTMDRKRTIKAVFSGQ